MIRKEGKARWTYTCELCRKRWIKPDQFRAIERHQRHVRSAGHIGEGFAAALRPMAEAFRTLGLAWGSAIDLVAQAKHQFQDDYALIPPPITPRRHSGNAEGA